MLGNDLHPTRLPGSTGADFERLVRQLFMRVQAANEIGDETELRALNAPEIFAAFKLDLLERGPVLRCLRNVPMPQRTEVLQLYVTLLDKNYFKEPDPRQMPRQVASVRFRSLIHKYPKPTPTHLDEIWHFVKHHREGHLVVAGSQQHMGVDFES